MRYIPPRRPRSVVIDVPGWLIRAPARRRAAVLDDLFQRVFAAAMVARDIAARPRHLCPAIMKAERVKEPKR